MFIIYNLKIVLVHFINKLLDYYFKLSYIIYKV